MARKDLTNEFKIDVAAAFGFLMTEHRFTGPKEDSSPSLYVSFEYSSSDLSVLVLYDIRESGVDSSVSGRVGPRNYHASLQCLYEKAGFGSAREVDSNARSGRLLRRALETQQTALRKVMPALLGAQRDRMLTSCDGR